ncbi:MAG: rhodanese-like domain-containing protein, partial [Turicibacter sp.]
LSDVPTDQDILVYCQVGFRGYLGLEILKQNSFKNVKNLSGGYRTYEVVQDAQIQTGLDCYGYPLH